MKTAPLWAILWSLIETAPYQRCKGKNFDFSKILDFFLILRNFFEIFQMSFFNFRLEKFRLLSCPLVNSYYTSIGRNFAEP